MKWIDFSYYGANLTLRSIRKGSSAPQLFIVAGKLPGADVILEKTASILVRLGFSEESAGIYVAPVSDYLKNQLFNAPRSILVDVDSSVIIDRRFELISDIENTIGVKNELTRNEVTGNSALEGISPNTLQSDAGAGYSGQGGDSSGGIDETEHGLSNNGRDERTGVVDRIATASSDLSTEQQSLKLNEDNFEITNDSNLSAGSYGIKLSDNIAAIRLVKLLDEDHRLPTQAEKEVLVKFTGWGGLKGVFDPLSTSRQDQVGLATLNSLLTPIEMSWALNGVLGQHLSPKEVIDAVYAVVDHIGFSGGNIIEPSYGTGHFIGAMPEHLRANSNWYGSEIDPIAGKIGQYLYPNATLLAGEGFQDAEFQYNKFDLAIGNPAFGDERISDNNPQRKDINRFRIHNYIMAKSAMHLNENGLMAMIVTHRFLDAKDGEARDFLAKNFDLVTAIRLPSDAFKNAGTKVTTDIVFFKKRDPELSLADNSWLTPQALLKRNESGDEILVNQFFVNNPHLMLGTPTLNGSMYAKDQSEFTLEPNGKSISEQVSALLANELAPIANLIKKNQDDVVKAIKDAFNVNASDMAVGGFVLNGEGRVYQRQEDDVQGNSVVVEITQNTLLTAKTAYGEKRFGRIKGLLELRNQTYALVAAERADKSNIETLRKDVNEKYDDFVKKYGYINDPANSSLIDGDIKIEFGLEKNYRSAISSAKASKRGQSSGVAASAEKADILSERVFWPIKEVLYAKDAIDGYSVSLSEKGRIDFDYIAAITGNSYSGVIAELSELENPLIFKDPSSQLWIQEDLYLSGNVKAKIKLARDAGEPFSRNVKALAAVQPNDVRADQIFCSIGQIWIPSAVYHQFLEECGVVRPKVIISDFMGTVTADKETAFIPKPLSDELLSERITVSELFNFASNKRNPVMYMIDGRGEKVVDREATKEASMLVRKMTATFRDWVFADDIRAKDLANIYNDIHNTTVERRFDGKHLNVLGSNPAISLRNTQKNAAWRMIQSDETLLDHVVGAGKTFTLVAGIMERKRLGLSNKPALIVPNHLVTQWAKDFISLYPAANILAATEKDFSTKNRRRLFARIATGQYDAVIMGHAALKRIPVDKESEVNFLTDELNELMTAMKVATDDGDKRGVRVMAGKIAKRREKIKNLNKTEKDQVITFNNMGIDYLSIDESHEFKNLEYSSGITRVAGMGNPIGSQKAFDLYMKINVMRTQAEDGDTRFGVSFATGTPISNSLVEMYAIMRYLSPHGLNERNLQSFDAWVKNYATIEAKIEYTATQKLKERTIMTNFNNIPELMQIYRSFGDIVLKEDLNTAYTEQIESLNKETGQNLSTRFPVPKVKNGGRILDIALPSEEQIAYMDYLIERALKIEDDKKANKFDPSVDNLLWVYVDAKKAALDIRVVDPHAESNENDKVHRAARNIFRNYHKWNDDKGTQLVFCDLSTPSKSASTDATHLIKTICTILNASESDIQGIHGQPFELQWEYLKNLALTEINEGDIDDKRKDSLDAMIETVNSDAGLFITADTGFSVYDSLRRLLIEMGIPAHEVQFIHDYQKASDKKDLFDQINAGEVRILLGSTSKMGAGTNVQERVVALHHIDSSMYGRPSDIEQREGRVVRQGNKLYERDPDNFEVEIIAYSTERTFDAVAWQLLCRKQEMLEGFRNGYRTIEEDHSDSASYMEFMAETTGNPIFREKIQLEGEINDLETNARRVRARLSSSRHRIENELIKNQRFESKIVNIHKAKEAIISNELIRYKGMEYKKDYMDVFTVEHNKYLKEKPEHIIRTEEYNAAYAEWKLKDKDDRGIRPIKPVDLDNPSQLDSPRMIQGSDQARFFYEILRDLDGGRVPIFHVGGLKFNVTHHLQDVTNNVYFQINDVLNIIEYSSFTRITKHGLIKELLEKTESSVFNKYLRDEERYYQTHKDQCFAAHRIVNTFTDDHKQGLDEKKVRYQEIVQIVSEIEDLERDRRLGDGNKYISMDMRRFKDGKLHGMNDEDEDESFSMSFS